MTGALIYPGADRTSRWFAGPDDFPNQFVMPRIDKTLLHSTETQKAGSCPGYGDGATAPQLTVNPWPGFQRVWQHFPLNRAGRALGNPSSTPVSENKDNVEQVEIIGFSDPDLGRRYGCYLPELPDSGLDYLANVLAFIHREWPHPTTLPSTWPLYKVSSWSAMGAAHMSSDAYDRFSGILAHLHAPVPSTHGDVALNIRSLKSRVDSKLAPAPAPPPPTNGDDMADMTVKHPTLTNTRWPVDTALWSMWTYSIWAARDAAITRALAEQAAKTDGTLDDAEVERIAERVGREFDERQAAEEGPTP